MTEERRGPGRPPLRPELREDDPRARAAKRAAEILEHAGGDIDDGPDNFYVDLDDIPEGWSYEWKRQSVYGKEDPAYETAVARKGWEPVPASRHPEYMPKNHAGKTIERDGMVLMERPAEITALARKHELKKARDQVRQKEQQLGAAPEGQFERATKDGSLVKVNKNYERIEVPQE